MKFNIIGYSFYGKSTGYYNISKEGLVGGGEVYLYDFAKCLLKEGHEVTVLQASDVNKVFDLDGIRVKAFKIPFNFKGSLGILSRYGSFNLFWKKHLDKDVDRIHFHDFMHAVPFGNKNMTGTSHGITWDNPYFVNWNKQGFQLRVYRNFIRPIAKNAIKRLGKVVANDTFLLRFVQSEMPQYRDKVEVIFNYVNLDVFNPDNKPSFRLKNFKFKDRKIVLFPRNFGYGRGGLLTVEALKIIVKKYPDVLLLMTGEGPEKNLVKKKVKEYNLEDNVVFLGHQDHFKDMPGLFSSADVVIVPSISTEGTSLSALEAMASKKPVVVTNVGGLLDIVIDGFNGLVCKPNPFSLAEKIMFYFDNPSEAKKIASKGYEWVKKYHNYKLWCKKYKEALNF